MRQEEFSKALLEEGKRIGFTDCEIYFQKGKNFEVLIMDGEVSHYENSLTQGVCFRGIKEGRVGYAYCEKISEDAVEFVIQQAKENAEIGEPQGLEVLFAGGSTYPRIGETGTQLNRVTEEEKIQAAKKMEQGALAWGKFPVAIDYCVLEYHEEHTEIENSKGLQVSFDKSEMIAHVSAIAQHEKEIKTGSEYWIGQNWEDFHPIEIGQQAAENAVSHLGAGSIPSGEYKVILENTVMAGLLSAFCSGFYGESVEKGFSMLKGKLNNHIASEKVTIRDDALLEGLGGSTPFDSEGVPCCNKEVISKGKLVQFLYNLKYANIAGVESTGNGFKASLQSPVQTACTNFYMVPGEKTMQELMSSMKKGLLITDIAGLHAGTNAISGDFSLSAEGFLVENGERGKPVEQITIAGNFYSLLQEIEDCGNQVRFGMPKANGTMGAPAVLIGKISVSGL